MKRMKKLWAVLLAVFLLATPVLALEQTASLAGEWTMTHAMASGMVLTPEMLGWGMSFVLNTDGTGKFSSTATGVLQEQNLTWTQAGNMVTITEATGDVVTLSLQADGTLRLAQDQALAYFTRTAAAPQTSTVPGGTTPGGSQLPPSGGTTPGGGLLPSPGDTPAATGFEGTWVVKQASMDGQTIDAAAAGIQMTLVFNAGGTGTLSDGYETLSCTWTQNGSTVNVTDPDGYVTVFTMQADGTITGDVDGLILTLAREGGSTATVPSGTPSITPSNTPAAAGQTVTGNGYTLQVPQGWMEINDATVQQLVQTYGQQAVDSAGLTQQLQQVKATGALLYYAADFNSSVNVVKENANGITMDTLLSLESNYASLFANAGMTNYKMGGPVEFSGKTYYTGTFDAAYPTMQYYQIVNDMFYTITLTNAADADAATILSSFTVNG